MASNARPHGGDGSEEGPKQTQSIATAQIALRKSIMGQIKELTAIALDMQNVVQGDTDRNELNCLKKWHLDERRPIRDYYSEQREKALKRIYAIHARLHDKTRSYDENSQTLASLVDAVGCWLLELLKMVEIIRHHVEAAPNEDGTGGGTIRLMLLLEALKQIAPTYD